MAFSTLQETIRAHQITTTNGYFIAAELKVNSFVQLQVRASTRVAPSSARALEVSVGLGRLFVIITTVDGARRNSIALELTALVEPPPLAISIGFLRA